MKRRFSLKSESVPSRGKRLHPQGEVLSLLGSRIQDIVSILIRQDHNHHDISLKDLRAPIAGRSEIHDFLSFQRM